MSTSWIEVAAPPIGVHVHDDPSEPYHNLTPEAIRIKRGSDIRLDSIVWRHENFCGLIIGITERTWESKDIEGFALSFCRPAKGGGSVSITIEANGLVWPDYFITSSKCFSEEQLIWSRQLLSAIKELGFKVVETDEGYDA